MKFNTAVCFALCGAALFAKVGVGTAGRVRLGDGLAFAALAVACITLVEYTLVVRFGIDALLVADSTTVGAVAPGRMARLTACGLVLSGLAVLSLRRQNSRLTVLSQSLALASGLIFLVVTLGYLYSAHGLYRTRGSGSVALSTALLFHVLNLGVLASQPDVGLMRPLTVELPAGRAARRLLPAVIVVPILLGWLRLAGQGAGLFGLEVGLALYATSNVMVLGALTWRTAASLGEAERQREEAGRAFAEAEALARAAKELHEQSLRLEEANRHKTQFLANMSHELRTPLNAIIGFATLLRGERSGTLNRTQKEHVAEVLNGGQHLLSLVNDVLDLSKVESGTLTVADELVDMTELMRSVTATFAAQVQQRRIRLSTEVVSGLCQVRGDERLMKQILLNYLSNAVKFTPDGGDIALRILEEDAHTFRVTVEDSGIGIKSEDLGRLFEVFQQLDSGSGKHYQGTGVGLALTKRFVEALGGRVEVSSELGRGSRFSAILPLRVMGVRSGRAPEIEDSHGR